MRVEGARMRPAVQFSSTFPLKTVLSCIILLGVCSANGMGMTNRGYSRKMFSLVDQLFVDALRRACRFMVIVSS